MSGERLPGNDAGLPRAGRIDGTPVPEVLWSLALERFSGSLVLTCEEQRKVLFFREGRLIFASSSDAEDRLGPFLLRRGQVALSVLLDAGGRVMRGRRLGQALVELGAMTQEEICKAVLDQVLDIALSVFSWRTGTWRLSRASLPLDEAITLDRPMEELVLEGLRRVEDWARIRKAVGGPRAIYRVRGGHLDTKVLLGLTERSLLEQLVHPCRVERLCREVYAPSYDVYRALWGLSILGLVQRVGPEAGAEPCSGAGEGLLEEEPAADLVLRLGDEGLTGVLRLFRGSEEGALFFREGRIEFATTNDPEQSLLVHLLRRGVISDRDHEMALRRLLTGKRVGQLLAEMGALGEDDIERFVCEQVLEVARQLVLWERGEYRVEEELPSEESIVLGWSAEDVVMAAMEHCEYSQMILRGVGGLETVYRLRPEYLDRLDRMQLRPGAWELVSLLREEKTLGELLAAREEADYEICRRLHGLCRVHVVEKVPEEEIADRVRVARTAPAPPIFAETPAEPAAPSSRETVQVEVRRDLSAPEMAPELFPADVTAGASNAWRPVLPEEEDEPLGGPEPRKIENRRIPVESAPMETDSGGESAPVVIEVPITAFGPFHSRRDPQTASPPEAVDAPLDPEATLKIPRHLLDLDASPAAEGTGGGEAVEAPVDVAAEPECGVEGASPVEEAAEDGTGWSEAFASRAERDSQAESAAEAEPAAESAEPFAEPDAAASAESVAEAAPAAEGPPAAPVGPPVPAEEAETEADVPALEPEATVTPDEAVLAEVKRFNRRHAAVFTRLRAEIGAGVRNYVRTCQRRLGVPVFGDLEPDSEGCFPVEELARRIEDLRRGGDGADPEALITTELSMVRELLSPARLKDIERALAALDE
ncbi:MAG: DUF4388 domain-containing protein [Acidobacteriota bacterium]|nr:DUF4388 domain-containing protein [Acidobacteriota bacterium]